MDKLKKLRKNYIDYLKSNPKAYKWLKESADLLCITPLDFKNK